MKKLIIYTMILLCLPLRSFAECNFATGIYKTDSGYLYSRECHLYVGEMKQDLGILTAQNLNFKQALELKDVALSKADARVDLWMNTTFKLEDRVNTLDKFKETNQWLYFGLGALAMFAATYAASQVYR